MIHQQKNNKILYHQNEDLAEIYMRICITEPPCCAPETM